MIPVTKPYLPNREKLDKYINGIYERNWLTNNGPLVHELTCRLEKYLGVENLLLVSNGTLALQVAYHTLGIHEPVDGKAAESITTPFTFIATASSLKWEGVEPVFVDIDPGTWCMAEKNIEAAITPQTRSLTPVHVFGNPCNVEDIQAIAEKHNLKVIYDAAHAFGVNYKGESLLKWGDAATLSFHATKVFHTIEGGAIVFKRKEDLDKAKALINFGITGPDQIGELGINAKMSEFNAAMGLCVLDEMENILQRRKQLTATYHSKLLGKVQNQLIPQEATSNYAYFPAALADEKALSKVMSSLQQLNVQARRYFYPSLDTVAKVGCGESCLNSLQLASRILCLPVYSDLEELDAVKIADTVLRSLE